MREKAAAGFLFILGLMLIVTGFPGTLGDLLAAVFAPEALTLNKGTSAPAPAPAQNGGGTAGGF